MYAYKMQLQCITFTKLYTVLLRQTHQLDKSVVSLGISGHLTSAKQIQDNCQYSIICQDSTNGGFWSDCRSFLQFFWEVFNLVIFLQTGNKYSTFCENCLSMGAVAGWFFQNVFKCSWALFTCVQIVLQMYAFC